jgi:peptidoglycan/xylan/chitin deacetylase (PgdA/CDA1 family)
MTIRKSTSRSARAIIRRVCLTVALVGIAVSLVPGVAQAAVQNPAAAPLVSFTFDDGFQSAITQAAPTLQKHGLTGTNYVVTGCVGKTTVPNNCRAHTERPYMTWAQIKQLQTTYGWEIGSHTATHQCLASAGDVCQSNVLTPAQVEAELANSKSALAAQGINATAFAAPYGDYNPAVVAKVAKYYSSLRGFADLGNNPWPLGDYLVRNVPVRQGVDTVASLRAKVDEAIATKTWVVFTFHDIATNPSTDPEEFQFSTAALDQLAAYVKTKVTAGQIRNVNVSKGLVTGDPNKLPNGTFNSGIGGGWTTDSPTTITADNAGNGSFPDATNSVRMVSAAGGAARHLFSPAVPVSPATTYLFKNFLSVRAVTAGEVGFYVDEYNAAGAWVSGQFRMRENSVFTEAMNFTYKPTSSSVATARLQVIVTGTGINAFLDNAQMFALTAETAAPPPVATNMVANGTFDAGISNGWSTNAPATIVADGANNGSPANPVNSVKMTAAAGNTSLFSPRVAVSSPSSYTIASYLNVKTRTSGEVAFYIDEYDASGNWISGQYKLGTPALGVVNVSLTYSPTSASVAGASLQVITVGNSGISAFFDHVRWTKN